MHIRSLLLIPLLCAALAARADEPPAGLTARAKAGDAEAMTRLGTLYLEGREVEQNDKKAVRYLQQAARLGDAEAQFLMGECLMNGRGIKPDCQAAVAAYREAAEQGHRDAQQTMAFLLSQGLGIWKTPRRPCCGSCGPKGWTKRRSRPASPKPIRRCRPTSTMRNFRAERSGIFALGEPDAPIPRGGSATKHQRAGHRAVRHRQRGTPDGGPDSEVAPRAALQGRRRRVETLASLAPATEDGVPVRIRYTIPVKFS